MRFIILLSFMLLFSLKSFGQKVHRILLEAVPSSGFVKSTLVPTIYDSCVKAKKVPVSVADDYLIKHVDFQKYFQDSSTKPKKSDRIYFLISRQKDGSSIFIPDVNNDLDFSNDTLIHCPVTKTRISPYFKFPIHVREATFSYYVKPYTYKTSFNYLNEIEQNHYLMIETFQEYQGIFQLDGNDYTILVHNLSPLPFFLKDQPYKIVVKNANDFKIFNSNETISIGREHFIVQSIVENGSQIILERKENNEKLYGYNEGFTLPQIHATDLHNNQFEFPQKGKYTLLDFWGTWCGPCKSLTENLKNIHNTYQNKLDLISVASDSKKELVENYVSKHQMNWKHVFELNNGKVNGLVNDFYIDSYPTFVLINEEGKIIARKSGIDGFAEIENIINKIK